MPIGVQLVGGTELDEKLLGVAKWLQGYLSRK
jgi:Asp-tRNA(Asn)/Glu-tRNA(Gln) amidotransferase A subunit family amidase